MNVPQTLECPVGPITTRSSPPHDGLRQMAGFDPRGQRQPMLGRDTLRVGLNLSIVGIALL
jgi:hypothetical protein